MVKPLNPRNFGNPEKEGKQICFSKVWLSDSTAAESGYYVLRQVGWNKYEVTNDVKVGVVSLVAGEPTKAGEGSVEVTAFGEADVKYAVSIQAHLVKTSDGNIYGWSGEEATKEGYADLPLDVVEPVVVPEPEEDEEAPVDPDEPE